ncbi:MAG: ISL3 family transposase [Actinomycetia bacterium]|nr:ISL3 family transposase [Actinomycetes bacterium]
MQSKTLWARAVGVDRRVVVEGVRVDEDDGSVVVSCRLRKNARLRCGHCERLSGRYDAGEGRRRWRALDAGTVKVHIEADAPRVRCRDHGVTVGAVPWARHGAGHTRDFDDQVGWLVTHTSKTAVVELMAVAWRTVGAIVARVVADARALADPFDGLVRIGIDEISYRRGHKYLMVVVDHDTGRLVWAKAGHDKATLQAFFDELGSERAANIKLVSADAAEWIGETATANCENATVCLDPFHIVRWATKALDVVRRWLWNALRHVGLKGRAKQLKGCRYALWKNPEDLTDRQAAKLAWIAKHNNRLYRAYLLKEQLRLVFAHRGGEAIAMLDAWLSWARRSQIPEFVKLYHRIKKHRAGIVASVTHGLSNGLTESVNTKLRLLTRIAYRLKSTHNLIALCLLDRGGHCPPLPGRT